MISGRISLDGTWEFRHTPNERIEPGAARPIQVPSPWQAQCADLRMKAGIGWYRRELELPAGWIKGRISLRFGAVFHNAAVWVNGVAVGEHEGGFLPFAFDVTHALQDEGVNEIVVRAESPVDDPAQHAGGPLAEVPFGKQSWYGPQSGIWQPVHLERRDADHIAQLRIAADLASGRVESAVALSRPVSRPLEIETAVHDGSGALVAASIDVPAQGDEALAIGLHVPGVQAWSPESPNLYRMTVSIREGGVLVDQMVETFGFRSIETRNGRLYLNGEPLYLRAALDQDYYPDGICTAPSLEFLEDQARKAKHLGLNCLRCHIKVADPRYYEVADRFGLLIWTELPNMGRMTGRSRERAEALLKGIVDRDGNHPSIIIWTIVNENWGTDLVHDPEHRAWLKRTYAWLKEYDPSRLVVDNSPLAPSMHVETDIADFHYYAAIPDHRDEWDGFVDALASRPAWLFSRAGDAVTTGEEPLMCSEFGNWGLPHPDDLKDADGREPWWFETGHDWGDGIMYAHGVENRFADWSLDRVFGTFRDFVDAAQWQQFRALKYEIEAMRRKPSLAGYVITEFTDCHWESNGLLDMRRNPRVFHDVFATINGDTVIVPRWERLSYWAGETARIEVAIAHGAGRPLVGAKLEIYFGKIYSFDVPPLEAGGVVDLGAIELTVPQVAHAARRRATLELRGADGTLLATNTIEMAVQPAEARTLRAEAGPVWAPTLVLRSRLATLGYEIAGDLNSAALAIATTPTPEITDWVREGGRLLLLPEGDMSLQPLFPHWQNVRVQNRDGTHWRGDWASTFAWLQRDGLFKDLPGEPLLDETFDRVIPTHVISGCNLLDFQSRVHAGMVIGWVHKPVALAIERAYGEGRLAVSTFRLFRDEAGADPTATILLRRLVTLAVGAVEQPQVEEVPFPAVAAA